MNGAFTKQLQNANISFVIPSVGPHGRVRLRPDDFREI